jgi:hypothetical protein
MCTCESGSSFEVGSYDWKNGPAEVACYGGIVTYTFSRASSNRANKRVVCKHFSIPPANQVNDYNACYLNPPTESQYPASIDDRLAKWIDASRFSSTAFSWSSPRTQIAYFSNGWFEDCTNSPTIGSVFGETSFSGTQNNANLLLFYQCARGEAPSTSRMRYQGKGQYTVEYFPDCGSLWNDIAETDFLSTQRDQTQASDCGDCGSLGMNSFMVLMATLKCSSSPGSLFSDGQGQGGSYFCEGNGGDGWRNGLARTYHGNNNEYVVCTTVNSQMAANQAQADAIYGDAAYDFRYDNFYAANGCMGTGLHSMFSYAEKVGMSALPAASYVDYFAEFSFSNSVGVLGRGDTPYEQTCSKFYASPNKKDRRVTVAVRAGSEKHLRTNGEIMAALLEGPVVIMLPLGRNFGRTSPPTIYDSPGSEESLAMHLMVILGYGSNSNGEYYVCLNGWGSNGVNNLVYWERKGGEGGINQSFITGSRSSDYVQVYAYQWQAFWAIPGEPVTMKPVTMKPLAVVGL